jgi:hypothetical protein
MRRGAGRQRARAAAGSAQRGARGACARKTLAGAQRGADDRCALRPGLARAQERERSVDSVITAYTARLQERTKHHLG